MTEVLLGSGRAVRPRSALAGSEVRARVFQSLLGPTEVVIVNRDAEVARFSGLVA